MSRSRINFVPINWIMMIVLATVFVGSLTSIQKGMTMNHTPIQTSVQALITDPSLMGKYVTVTGELKPDIAYQYGNKKSDGSFDVDDTWMLMVTPQTVNGIFVKVPNADFDDKKPRQVLVTGTWESMDSNLESEVDKENFKADGLNVNVVNVLNAGAAPPQPGIWVLVMAVSGVLLAAFIVTFLRQYVIFQAQPASGFSSSNVSPAAPPSVIRVTGEFAIEMRDRKRFLNVPTNPTTLENGHLALLSNIDASSRFFGVKTNNRSGVWLVAIVPASIQNVTRGSFYLGGRSFPAIRFRYEDGVNSSRKTVVLSLPTIGEREAVLTELERMTAPAVAL
ncbi:hypothetical protein [Capsulimonas corticalis]|nr:hypothetical protein [Capsulimonas corticalis]